MDFVLGADIFANVRVRSPSNRGSIDRAIELPVKTVSVFCFPFLNSAFPSRILRVKIIISGV